MSWIILRVFLLLVVLSPLPFASNRPWAWYAYTVGLSIVALVWLIGRLIRPAAVSLTLNPALVVLFAAPCAWVLLQIHAGAPSGWLHPVWSLTAESTDLVVSPRITVSADRSIEALIRLLGYGLTFFLAFQLSRNQRNALTIMRWIALCGTAYAVFGLAVYWNWVETLFWREIWSPTDVTSTFRNRNNFATFAGLVLICLLALLAHGNQPGLTPMRLELRGRGGRIERFITRGWAPLVGLMLVFTALFLSHSRGGFIAAAAGILLFTVLLMRRQKGFGEPQTIIAGLVSVLLVFVWSISGSGLVQRFAHTTLDREGRDEVYRLLIEAIAREPWRGHGYGTFAESFRLYQNAGVQGFWDLAHNTYLENAFELGVPAAASLCLAIALAGATCLRGSFVRRRDWMFPMAAASATLLVGLHALFDFSLQIPAVAVTYATILGVGLAQSYRLSESRERVANDAPRA